MPTPADDIPPELRHHPKYRVERRLGSGGMGEVFLARHAIMDKLVAIKVIRPALLSDVGALARFHAEVRAAAKLEHANIVRAYDADRAGEIHFLVMEYVSGATLTSYVAKKGPLAPALACSLIQRVADGLQHAHDHDMVHRDIKPHNLMVTPKGQVKILDFGLAKLLIGGGGATSAGLIMGTPEYMAPEQANGRPVDSRADIYALGCTLFHLLAGRPPFALAEGDNPIAVIVAKSMETAPDVRTFAPEVPARLAALIAAMIAIDPAMRPSTPRDVIAALRTPSPARTAPVAAAPTGTWAELTADTELIPVRPSSKWPLSAMIAGFALAELTVMAFLVIALRPVDFSSSPKPSKPTVADLVTAQAQTPNNLSRPLGLDSTEDDIRPEDVQALQRQWAAYLGVEVEEEIEIANGVKMAFLLIPPGRFRMGSPEGEENRDEDELLHVVSLTEPFFFGKTEVTQAQYEALTGDNPSQWEGATLPVENVTLDDCKRYADNLTFRRADKRVYRLPTEAEWEYSCRGGLSSSRPFCIGDNHSLSSRIANFDGRNPYGGASKDRYLEKTCAVGSYKPNSLGLSDMHGNVWEWCADWYGTYPIGEVTNPPGPTGGDSRVHRGGCWSSGGKDCRSAYRNRDTPGFRSNFLGFRLVRSPVTSR